MTDETWPVGADVRIVGTNATAKVVGFPARAGGDIPVEFKNVVGRVYGLPADSLERL